MVYKKYDRRRVLLAAAACFIVIAVLTFYLWHLTENVRLGYTVTEAQSQRHSLEKDIKRLKTERETLSSPEVVEKIAREELGLQDVRDDQVIYEVKR
jgi:cell division protein FtsL